MCTNRLYIKNNCLDFNPITDRFFNYVPCGKCEECLATKQSDLATRLTVHSRYIRENGGIVLYFTLTYDDPHLPKYLGKPVFNRRHIDSFLDNLRHKFKFDYFICSEYGSKFFRPHYHGLLFIPGSVWLNDVKKWIDFYWPYGRIDYSQNNGVVLGAKPTKYVSKYVSKDPNFLSLLASQKRFSMQDVENFQCYKKTLYSDLSILPFSLISNGVGSSLASTLSFVDFVNGFFYLSDDTGFHQKTMIPLYILRKVLKNTYRNKNGNISYVYNDFGLAVLRARLLKKYETLKFDYLHLFDFGLANFHNINYLKNRFAYDEFKEFCKTYGCLQFCERLSAYNILYRGLDESRFSGNFKDDVDIYISDLESGLYVDFKFGFFDKFYNLVTTILDQISKFENYCKYKERVMAFNARQLLLSKKTGKYKPLPVKNFLIFNNFCFKNVCFSILSKKLAA